MNLTEKNNDRIQAKICDKNLTDEISNDYTLPDYQPEIRRVLKITAAPMPPAKYVSGNNAEMNGTVDYELLYVASDGKLYSAPLSAEYSLTAPLEITNSIDLGEGVLLFCEPKAESVTARVSGPRKLSVKCRIGARVRAYAAMVLDALTVGESCQNSIQTLTKELSSRYTVGAIGDMLEIDTEISCDTDSTRVICASAEAYATEVRADEAYADCKGEVLLRLLVCNDNSSEPPRLITHKLPFSDRLDIDGIDRDFGCRAICYVSDVSVTVDEGRISCSVNLLIDLSAQKNITSNYVKDVYSTENFTETAYKTQRIFSSLACFNANFSQNERIKLEDTSTIKGANAILCRCDPSVEECSFASGKYAVSGICKYSVLCEKDGDYSIYEQPIPFKYEFNGSEQHSDFLARLSPISCNARIDGDSLAIDSELSVCAELASEDEISLLSEVRFGEPLVKKCGDMILCYPSPEDSLWSVSKRYCVPMLSLPNVTDPEDKLDGIKFVTVNS